AIANPPRRDDTTQRRDNADSSLRYRRIYLTAAHPDEAPFVLGEHHNPACASRRRISSLGVVPIIRLTVRDRWAASAKPVRCAASVTVAPSINSRQACCRRNQRM